MDYAEILASIQGLETRLREAGLEQWLKQQPKVQVDGGDFVVIAGDRLASEAEAALTFAFERGLVTNEEVQQASSSQSLPSDVEATEIEAPEGNA